MVECPNCGGAGAIAGGALDCIPADLQAGEVGVVACPLCYVYRDDLDAALSFSPMAREVPCEDGGAHAVAPLYTLVSEDHLARWIETAYAPRYGDNWTPWQAASLAHGEGPNDPRIDALAIYTDQAHDADAVSGLVSYFFAGRLRMGWGFQLLDVALKTAADDGHGHLFFFACDLTETQSSQPIRRVDTEFFPILIEGTKARVSDRAGPGTRGTRKHNGLRGNVMTAWRLGA